MKQDVQCLQQKIEEIDQKIQDVDKRVKVWQARGEKKTQEIKYRERKQRAHRLIGIGAEVQSVLGRTIPAEELVSYRRTI